MSRDEGLATALFALVTGGAISLAIANDITAPACVAAQKALSGSKDFDFGCLEFWLNRYQSLIGSVLTGAAATAAVYWAARQLSAANRQASTAAASALRLRVRDIEDELKAVEQLDWLANEASAMARDLAYYRDIEARRAMKAKSRENWTRFCSCREQLRAWHRANRSDPITENRSAYMSAIDEIGYVMGQVQMRAAEMSDFNSPTDNEIDYFERLEAEAKSRFPRFFPTASNMREQLVSEVAATWRQIREFERAAVAD